DYEALSQMVSEDTSIQEAMRKNMELSQKIGLQGTPFFILNGTAIRGAIRDYSVFADIIKETEKEQAAAKSNDSKEAKK
uniref:DsbA family protein n=1 Tax=Anaerobiospirillum succiniciproducens TaxID=13335 RepID=UPI002941F5AD